MTQRDFGISAETLGKFLDLLQYLDLRTAYDEYMSERSDPVDGYIDPYVKRFIKRKHERKS
jgi:hypothetical protein